MLFLRASLFVIILISLSFCSVKTLLITLFLSCSSLVFPSFIGCVQLIFCFLQNKEKEAKRRRKSKEKPIREEVRTGRKDKEEKKKAEGTGRKTSRWKGNKQEEEG